MAPGRAPSLVSTTCMKRSSSEGRLNPADWMTMLFLRRVSIAGWTADASLVLKEIVVSEVPWTSWGMVGLVISDLIASVIGDAVVMTNPLCSAVSSSMVPWVRTRPWTMMATRSQTISSSERRCELRKTVRPSSLRWVRMLRMSRRPEGSTPSVGSSRTTSLGSFMSAWARPTRWRMPLE